MKKLTNISELPNILLINQATGDQENATIELLTAAHKDQILEAHEWKLKTMPDPSQLFPASAEELDEWLNPETNNINLGVFNQHQELVCYKVFTHPGQDSEDNLGLSLNQSTYGNIDLNDVFHAELTFVANNYTGNQLQYLTNLIALTHTFQLGFAKWVMATTHPDNGASKHNLTKSGIPVIYPKVEKSYGVRDIHGAQITKEFSIATQDKLVKQLNKYSKNN